MGGSTQGYSSSSTIGKGGGGGLHHGNGGQIKRTVWETPAVRSCQLVIQQFQERDQADHRLNTAVPDTRLNYAMCFSGYWFPSYQQKSHMNNTGQNLTIRSYDLGYGFLLLLSPTGTVISFNLKLVLAADYSARSHSGSTDSLCWKMAVYVI